MIFGACKHVGNSSSRVQRCLNDVEDSHFSPYFVEFQPPYCWSKRSGPIPIAANVFTSVVGQCCAVIILVRGLRWSWRSLIFRVHSCAMWTRRFRCSSVLCLLVHLFYHRWSWRFLRSRVVSGHCSGESEDHLFSFLLAQMG